MSKNKDSCPKNMRMKRKVIVQHKSGLSFFLCGKCPKSWTAVECERHENAGYTEVV